MLYEDSVPDVCFRVTSGAVALALPVGAMAPRLPSVVLGRGFWCGGEGLLTSEALAYSATALTECRLIVVRKAALHRAMREQPPAVVAFVRTLKDTHEAVLREVAAARCASVAERLRSLLAKLALCAGLPAHGYIDLPLRMTQDKLALLAGATRQQVNVALQGLRDQDLVDWRGGRYRVRPALVAELSSLTR